MSPERRERQRKARALLWLTAVLLVLGLAALWPVLEEMHQRVRPWEAPLHWVGDGVALFWFLRLLATHGVGGRPLEDAPVQGPRGLRAWWPALSLVAAAFVDLGYAVYSLADELDCRLHRARLTTGSIVDYYRIPDNGPRPSVSYYFTYEFQAPQGTWHSGSHSTTIHEGGRCVHPLPQEVVEGLSAGRKPLPLRVAYDPDWPARSWPAEIANLPGRQLASFSVLFFLAHFLILPAVVIDYVRSVRRGVVPWWHDLLPAVPMMGQAAMLFVVGLVRYVGFVPYQGN
jgi:hypothetical protein